MGNFNKLKIVLIGLVFLTGFGCAQNANEDVWPESQNPTILDEIHHQDLINLSDLELPQPVDRSFDNPAPQVSKGDSPNAESPTVDSSKANSRSERVAITQPRQNPPIEIPPTKKEEIKPKPPKKDEKVETPPKTDTDKKSSDDKPVVKEGRGSVYYIPVITQIRKCDEKSQVHMRDLSGQILALLCKNEIADCAMQGSCYYTDGKDIKMFAYRKLVEIKDPQTGRKFSEPRFVINNEHSRCPHGMGFRRICLDPYRSVAADMKFHNAGDVFYIPVLKGQILPNGEAHDGYVVVRDIGGAILGEGRFDFFIGFDSYVGHVFSKLNLSNPNRSTFTYYKVPENRAEEVRKLRAYPMVPSRVHNQALSALGRNPNTGVAKAAMSQVDIASDFFRSKFEFDLNQ